MPTRRRAATPATSEVAPSSQTAPETPQAPETAVETVTSELDSDVTAPISELTQPKALESSETPEQEQLNQSVEIIVQPLPNLVQLADGRSLHATNVGLPNTCAVTGQSVTERWWAENKDAARAGGGICEAALWELLSASPDDDE